MQKSDIIKAWGAILTGRKPSLSIEITKECPLRCPGCYAYEDGHLGGGETLRTLTDRKGQALVDDVMEVVDRLRPLHLSIVGGDPLVRFRELEELVPLLMKRDIHVQIVTSAFRAFPSAWGRLKRLTVVVSIDGLQPEHDLRRAPATYARILKNIASRSVTIHSTITSQMLKRPGYLRDFLAFWTPRSEIDRVWFSVFTPQVGDELEEILTARERERVRDELIALRREFPKLDMHESLIRQLTSPPESPEECIFAQTTETISADLETRVTPCQLGGNPDCSSCGCIAAMGLGAVGAYKLGGLLPVGAIFRASLAVGRAWPSPTETPRKKQPALRVVS